MQYWVFKGGPIGRSASTLSDARRKAIAALRSGHEYMVIVSATHEPYDWLGNYRVIGTVVSVDGRYEYYPKDKKKDCYVIDSNGNPKNKIPRPRFW